MSELSTLIAALDDATAEDILATLAKHRLQPAEGTVTMLTPELSSALANITPDVDEGTTTADYDPDVYKVPKVDATPGELARSILLLLAEDPDRRRELEALLTHPSPPMYATAAVARMAQATVALVVLQMYLKLQHDRVKGWQVQLEKQPHDSSLLWRIIWLLGQSTDSPQRTERDRVVRVLERLPQDVLDALCVRLSNSRPDLPRSIPEAERLVWWAESTDFGLEPLVVCAHQVAPLKGILQQVYPEVSPIDTSLALPVSKSIPFAAAESRAAVTDKVAMLVAVDDESRALDDVPDFRTLSRLGRIIAGLGSARSIDALRSRPGVLSVEASPPCSPPECAVSVPFVRAHEVHQHYAEKGDRALIAVIDVGIDVLHEAFRDDHGKSRIIAVWDQQDDTGPAPPGHSFGTLHTQDDINRYIAIGKVGKKLAIEPNCHGTHVASIAAGSACASPGFAGGVAPEAKLVIVVARIDPETGSPNSLGYSIPHLAALNFIRSVAQKENLPVVVNVSLGAQAGAHDGLSLLEVSFDEFSGFGRTPGLVIVKSAGNDRDSKLHATVPVSSRSVAYLDWSSPRRSMWLPRARRKDMIDLWYPPWDELRFCLINPDGEQSATLSWSNTSVVGTFSGGNTYRLEHVRRHKDNGHSRVLITIEHGRAGVIAEGTWRLKITAGVLRRSFEVDAWIDRTDDQLASFQTYMAERGTLSVPGTARTVISVGAVTPGELIELAPFSAWGPTRDGREKPEVAAPGMGIRAAASTTGSGDRHEDGTSMAAPHVTGAIALLLSLTAKRGDQPLNANQVREAVTAAVRDGNGSWHPGTGYGVIDTVKLLEAFGLSAVSGPQSASASPGAPAGDQPGKGEKATAGS
jgi:endonuclease G